MGIVGAFGRAGSRGSCRRQAAGWVLACGALAGLSASVARAGESGGENSLASDVGIPPAPFVPSLLDPPTLGPGLAAPVPPTARAALRLVLFDVQNAVPFAFDVMTREVSRLFRDQAVDVSWRKAAADDFTGPGDTQVIVLDSTGVSGLSERVMGATRRDPGMHAVWAFLPNVAWTLGVVGPRETWSGQQRAEIGRGLGRVIAHELVHLLAPALPHASAGLMSSRLGRAALLDRRLRLDPALAGALARSLAEARAPSPPPLPGLSAGLSDRP